MDYKNLCLELFGTDDPNKLAKIAKQLNKKNARNAGRKKMFDEQQIIEMQSMQTKGISINEIAKHFNTSRQVISKYINSPIHKGCTLRMHYMYKQTPCTIIDVDFFNEKIYIKNKTNDILKTAFGVIEKPKGRTAEDNMWIKLSYYKRDM